jgi:hypothetical protein
MEAKKAEDSNYWQTLVRSSKSQGEIMELLNDFGASNYQITQGRTGEKLAWLIRFEWMGRSYRFLFTPLDCRDPDAVHSFGGGRRAHQEQAVYQMGRIAVWFVKAILTAAEAHPHALFGFMELPESRGPSGLPATAGELDISGITSALPALPAPDDTFR